MAKQTIIQKQFYVYAILVDGIIRYIGKGTKRRYEHHEKYAKKINIKRGKGEKIRTTKFYNRLAKAIKNRLVISHKILKRFDTENEALSYEAKKIAKIGLDNLWNVHADGKGWTSKEWLDPKFRRRMSKRKSKSGSDNPMFGKTHSDEAKNAIAEKISKISKEIWKGAKGEKRRREMSIRMSKFKGVKSPHFGKPGPLLGLKGPLHHAYGIKRSKATKIAISIGVAAAHARQKRKTGNGAFRRN